MSWLIFTTLSIISRAIYGVMTKVLSNKSTGSIYTQATLLPLSAAIISLIISPFLGGLSFNFTHVNLLVLLLVILGQGIGNIIYFASIKHLNSSTAQISFSSILVFNTVLSLIFLNLHLSFINIIGLFLLMFAILIAVQGRVNFNRKGIFLMILSALSFSVFQLSSAGVSKQISSPTYLVTAYLGAAIVVFLFKWKGIINDISKSNLHAIMTVPILTAIPSLGNFTFAYFAYRIAPQPGKVAMLLTSQVVLAVLMSHFIFKEKSHLGIKIFAAILVVASAILIKI